jgi:hypothetical protein
VVHLSPVSGADVIRAEGTIVINRPARTILDFVLDLDRYRQADAKITSVDHQPSLGPDNREGRARYRGRLRGLPTPYQWQTVRLEPWTRLELQTEPGQWTAALATFVGGFICEQASGGATKLTHFEQFDFRPPARWIIEPYLRRWMQQYLMEVELPRLKVLIEAS